MAGAAAAGAGAGGWLLAAAHAAATAWVWKIRRRPTEGRLARVVADWSLPALFPLLYAELPLLMAAVPGPVTYRDTAVRVWERALFGGEPAFEWASALPVTLVSELLHLGYLLYYPLIYVPLVLLWLGLTGPRDPARAREAFGRTVLALGIAMLSAFAVMVVWPVQGPRYLHPPEGVPGGPFRAAVLAVLESGSSRGAAFPSSHVSVAVAQTIAALRWQRRVGLAAAVVTVLLSLGAVYGGFHYLVDVVAGAGLGAAAGLLALRVGGLRTGLSRSSVEGPRPGVAGVETPHRDRG